MKKRNLIGSRFFNYVIMNILLALLVFQHKSVLIMFTDFQLPSFTRLYRNQLENSTPISGQCKQRGLKFMSSADILELLCLLIAFPN